LSERQAEVREQVRKALQDKLDKTNGIDYTANRAHRKSHRRHLSSKQKKLQREHREAQVTQKDSKKSRFHDDLASFAKVFKKDHTEQAAKQRKLLRSIASFHTQREREEKKKAGEAEKKRIRALKENDEEGYMKLLEDTKNDRLLTLVRETDSALYSLGAKIRAHKTETMSASAAASLDAAVKRGKDRDGTVDSQDEASTKVHPDLLKTKEAYYEVSHTVKEAVTEQPLSLAGGKLKEYQIKGLEWLVSLYNNGLNGILADEMGLGKTIQTIAVLCHVMEKQNNTGPFLVVVPNSTLPNWANEFEQWAPHMERVIYKGSKAARKVMQNERLANRTFNVLVTTYEYVLSDKAFLSKTKWKYIIVDEGHRIKNHKSKLSIVLGSQYIATNRLLLTGTPLHNNLPELWSLLNFLLPDIFSSMKDFESWFNAPFENTGQKAEMTEEEELLIINRLHQVLRPFLLRRLKSEVMLELPQKTEKVIKCDVSGWQTHLYRRVLEGKGIFSNNVNGSGRSGIQMMNNDLMQLRKICNHPHIFYDVEDVDESIVAASGKVHMLDRILPKLKKAGHRVLIFSQMTQLMDILEDYFDLREFKYLRLDGSTSVDDRAEQMRLFQEDGSEYFIFLLSTRAGGMGINLQTADTVIIFDSDWNPQMDKQAQDRAHRIGQKTEVRVLRLISAGTVEVAILNQARAKVRKRHF
jgi:ATP-dependent helicase STH1/SNF2